MTAGGKEAVPPRYLTWSHLSSALALGIGSAAVGLAVWPCCVYGTVNLAVVLPLSPNHLHEGDTAVCLGQWLAKCDAVITHEARGTLVACLVLSVMSVCPAAGTRC